MNQSYAQLEAAAQTNRPALAVILGSGLSELTQRVADPISVDYADIPGMPQTSVAGHHGRLVFGRLGERFGLFFQGRFHRYEGHSWEAVLRPIHLAHALGADKLLATNAAGGIRDDLTPGCAMVLDGALDWTGNDWANFNQPRRDLFDGQMLKDFRATAKALSMDLPSGVYLQMLGPNYETPAEVRALHACGADAVGMSTVRELAAAHALGMRCAGLSLITNNAAGLSDAPLNHSEVLEIAAQKKHDLITLLEHFARRC